MATKLLLDIIKKRRSIRDYSAKPVEEEKIKLLLEAARLAPSSSNTQPWHFVAVKDKELIKKLPYCVPLGIATINKWMVDCPLVIVGCGKPRLSHVLGRLIGIRNMIIDVTIAMEHIVLQATELGLGTCWIGWFSEKKVKQLLKIPAGYKIVSMLTVGYPGPEVKKVTPRKSLGEIFSLDIFKQQR